MAQFIEIIIVINDQINRFLFATGVSMSSRLSLDVSKYGTNKPLIYTQLLENDPKRNEHS